MVCLPRYFLVSLAVLIWTCSACSMPPDHDHVFKHVPLYKESIDLTMQMLANDDIYERLEQSLPNIKRAHGLEKEHCLILTGWSPVDKALRGGTTAQRLHRLEQFNWHLHKKNPDKKITSNICPNSPCALIFSMQYRLEDDEFMDMGIDILTRDNYLFSVKIHGNATVMLREKDRFTRELEQIRQTLVHPTDFPAPQT